MKIHCTTCSMIGPKRRNEDAVFAKMYEETGKGLFIVCDGMGGLHKGDEASKTVTDIFASVWEKHHAEWNTEQMLQEAVVSSKTVIDTLSRYDVGTTMVLAAVEGSSVTIAHLGDSRAYYFRPNVGVIHQTEDHITIGQEGWPYVSKGLTSARWTCLPSRHSKHSQATASCFAQMGYMVAIGVRLLPTCSRWIWR